MATVANEALPIGTSASTIAHKADDEGTSLREAALALGVSGFSPMRGPGSVAMISTREGGRMSARHGFSMEEARQIGEQIGIDWATAPFAIEQFRRGLDVELEHGLHDLLTNVTDDDPLVTGKIALAHLHEFPDYYTRLERMEEQAKRDHGAA